MSVIDAVTRTATMRSETDDIMFVLTASESNNYLVPMMRINLIGALSIPPLLSFVE